jgi:FRG domain
MQTPDIYEYLVYLRHHGFPSPLLDWSASPYVAAFFAFDSPPKEAERVAVYTFLQDTIDGVSSDAHLFIVGPYLRSDPRHLLQQCRYSICIAVDPGNDDF